MLKKHLSLNERNAVENFVSLRLSILFLSRCRERLFLYLRGVDILFFFYLRYNEIRNGKKVLHYLHTTTTTTNKEIGRKKSSIFVFVKNDIFSI